MHHQSLCEKTEDVLVQELLEIQMNEVGNFLFQDAANEIVDVIKNNEEE
jgi:hypothetical protein